MHQLVRMLVLGRLHVLGQGTYRKPLSHSILLGTLNCSKKKSVLKNLLHAHSVLLWTRLVDGKWIVWKSEEPVFKSFFYLLVSPDTLWQVTQYLWALTDSCILLQYYGNWVTYMKVFGKLTSTFREWSIYQCRI